MSRQAGVRWLLQVTDGGLDTPKTISLKGSGKSLTQTYWFLTDLLTVPASGTENSSFLTTQWRMASCIKLADWATQRGDRVSLFSTWTTRSLKPVFTYGWYFSFYLSAFVTQHQGSLTQPRYYFMTCIQNGSYTTLKLAKPLPLRKATCLKYVQANTFSFQTH